MKTTIVKLDNSLGVRLPRRLLESADVGEQDVLEVTAEKHRIIIRKADQRPRKTIQERFDGFSGVYDAEVIDWGGPEGKEA